MGSWTDVIAGISAAQPVTGNQPELVTNGINGHNAVQFSSSASQYLTVAAANSPMSGAGSFTLAVVFKTTTPGNSSSSFFLNTGLLGAEQPNIVDDWAFCLNGSQLGAGLGSAANQCSADFSVYGGSVTDGNPHIGMYVRSGDTVSLYVDGVLVASQNRLCTDARLDSPFLIGAMTPSSYYFNGEMAEIQIYNRALTAAEITGVNETLAATYGVGGAAGPVVVWGNNSSSQVNVPANVTHVLAIASGSESAFSLALQGNGTVIGWGNNSQSQTSVPPSLTNVTAIAAGSTFSLAIGNQAPLVTNLTVSGYVSHDVVCALAGFSPDGNPLSFYLQSLPANGTLYQFAAGVRGPQIQSANTLVTDPGGQVIFVPAPEQTGNPYATFDFYANDGFYSSGLAQVAVNLEFPALPQFTGFAWNPGSSTAESFNLNFSGNSNATYSVWASSNLVNWINLGTAIESPPGQYGFVDTSVTNWPQQFYRISAP